MENGKGRSHQKSRDFVYYREREDGKEKVYAVFFKNF